MVKEGTSATDVDTGPLRSGAWPTGTAAPQEVSERERAGTTTTTTRRRRRRRRRRRSARSARRERGLAAAERGAKSERTPGTEVAARTGEITREDARRTHGGSSVGERMSRAGGFV